MLIRIKLRNKPHKEKKNLAIILWEGERNKEEKDIDMEVHLAK